jgi:hypothetical protein
MARHTNRPFRTAKDWCESSRFWEAILLIAALTCIRPAGVQAAGPGAGVVADSAGERVTPALNLAEADPRETSAGRDESVDSGSASDAKRDLRRSGPYIGGGFTLAIEDFDLPGDKSVTTDQSIAFHVFAGYRLNRLAAAELEFQLYETLYDEVALEGWSLVANAKVYPLPWHRVQPHAIVGLGLLEAEPVTDCLNPPPPWHPVYRDCRGSSKTAFLASLGGGIDIYATERIVAHFKMTYALPADPLDTLQFVPIGLGAHFRF